MQDFLQPVAGQRRPNSLPIIGYHTVYTIIYDDRLANFIACAAIPQHCHVMHNIPHAAEGVSCTATLLQSLLVQLDTVPATPQIFTLYHPPVRNSYLVRGSLQKCISRLPHPSSNGLL